MCSVVTLTALNLLALAMASSACWWGYVFAALFWPIVAFIGNLVDPIQASTKHSEGGDEG